jgi:soluble lytic murein transglycosylase-like protein
MWGRLGGVVVAVFVASCASRPGVPRPPAEPAAPPRAAAQADALAARFGVLAAEHPALADYAAWFRLRAALRARDLDAARVTADEVLALRPTVWEGPATLAMGLAERRAEEPERARAWLELARLANRPGGEAWTRAALALAEAESARGEAERALALADEVRRARPRGLAARRARRLEERVRRTRPDLPPVPPVEEAERALREGDAARARRAADAALAGAPTPDERARALWTRAHAERAAGDRGGAMATCLLLARAEPDHALAPRALVAAATWRWNADDDAGALELFRETTRRFPASPQAADALYGIARIHQEAGRYAQAFATYDQLARRFPGAKLADEARWRGAWVRYLSGQHAAAERAFRALAVSRHAVVRVAAEYWRARSLERLGRREEARARFAHVAEEHETSYYADLAEARLGRTPPPDPEPVAPPTPFPGDLVGPHAARARVLADLGLRRFARRELDAARDTDAPPQALLQAYTAIGAPGPAIRLARSAPGDVTTWLYPLGYWDLVEPAARRRGLDPLLVAALIRQESLYDPEAVSPARAHGLMQLLPSTAREVAAGLGGPPPSGRALHDPAVNVELGTAYLARLLERYGGSRVKALAAYNAGEDAVAKWERRYAGRDVDEFVELISYRETRDYVKAVLANYRRYRRLYAASA